MSKTVYFGAFNAEAHLDDRERYVQLPAIADNDADKIIHSMDELLFPLCAPDDFLITRYAIKTVQKQYLESIGIRFNNNKESIDTDFSRIPTVMELLIDNRWKEKYRSVFTSEALLSPYAQISQIKPLCEFFEVPFQGPPVEVVKGVNSKIYSHEMHEILGIARYSEKVRNVNDLRKAVANLSGSVLLKYPNGVSGKGNLLIQSDTMFERMVRFFEAQIKNGKELELLVEPLLDKMIDFSCQMKIELNGHCRILSVQQMENNNFAYWGSNCAEDDLCGLLETKQYFQLMQRVGSQLYADGYFGNVCVDSMFLKDKTLVPIVEINARKSMGLINYSMNEHLRKESMKSHLRFLSVGINSSFSYERLLETMDSCGLLYKKTGKSGILPLASNALTVNRDADVSKSRVGKIYKGRLYFSAAASDMASASILSNSFRDCLKKMGLAIYN
ncbi:MAG: hypothetical protein JW915_01190 [Chitinispirillaceae bacterium]|nr:hypothetical protein [Chitinispirillaceae bacterium]